jgi:hypothetical protein
MHIIPGLVTNKAHHNESRLQIPKQGRCKNFPGKLSEVACRDISVIGGQNCLLARRTPGYQHETNIVATVMLALGKHIHLKRSVVVHHGSSRPLLNSDH